MTTSLERLRRGHGGSLLGAGLFGACRGGGYLRAGQPRLAAVGQQVERNFIDRHGSVGRQQDIEDMHHGAVGADLRPAKALGEGVNVRFVALRRPNLGVVFSSQRDPLRTIIDLRLRRRINRSLVELSLRNSKHGALVVALLRRSAWCLRTV